MMISVQPAATASSTPYWISGLSTIGSISLGVALVAGKKRVPNPAAGKTALRTFINDMRCSYSPAPAMVPTASMLKFKCVADASWLCDAGTRLEYRRTVMQHRFADHLDRCKTLA